MTQACPARVGEALGDVDTPALIVDLDAYERNLARMADIVGGAGLRLRPHAKTHKSPLIALDQMALGAVGVCCQKIAEAEVMVQGGVRDVLISNQVVGPGKLDRVAALAKLARVAVCVDDAGNIADLSAAAKRFGATVDVLVEIDVGAGRCGVPPGDAALALAQQVDAAAGLRFAGLQAYHGGAQHIRDFGERGAAVGSAAQTTQGTVAQLAAAGLDCAMVTGGGTGSLDHDVETGVLNELQAGSYIFMDADYGQNKDAAGEFVSGFEHSLFVRATVISATRPGGAVLDAGLKALAFDSGPPVIAGLAGARYGGASDEHGKLILDDGVSLKVGDQVMLIPGHCDPTVNLYDWYVGVRGGVVERLWPVAARGALA